MNLPVDTTNCLVTAEFMAQDYSIIGQDTKAAEASGLAKPSRFRPRVTPSEIRALMVKDDKRALRDTLLWLGLMVLFAGIGIALWPSWWSAPFWFIYGVLYGSGSDARWHECGDRTAFETP